MNLKKSDKMAHARVLRSGLHFDESRYEFDDGFVPAKHGEPWDVHTTAEMVACLEADKNIQIDAKVLGVSGNRLLSRSLEREDFIRACKNEQVVRMREYDAFSYDPMDYDSGSGNVGSDFTPYLGGPYFKNLYFYQDYIRMHAQAFWALHHDPVAKLIVNTVKNFTLGRGFRVDSDNKTALAVWRAYERVNELQDQMRHVAVELATYGEIMFWGLPNMQTGISYKPEPGNEPPVGAIPRVKLIDPSNLVEIVTVPEDINRRLFYVWMAPTQWQMFTNEDPVKGRPVQSALKFIYRQIPADQIMHFRVNSVSNEKRGRSDFFPALGYMKRLRDSVNYSIISMQKQSAFSIDTAIDGAPEDVDQYVTDQQSLGTIAGPGSEFAHTKKVERKFLSPEAGRSGQSEAFEWCLSMIAMAVGIPVSYFGTHLSGAQTRASAVVSTDPVSKLFEMRQLEYEKIIKANWDLCMRHFGIKNAECEITFPDLITQDRSAKLKDLALMQAQKWIKPERAAQIAVKEMGVTEYDYEKEVEDIKGQEDGELLPVAAPLSTPGKTSGLPSQDRKEIKQEGMK